MNNELNNANKLIQLERKRAEINLVEYFLADIDKKVLGVFHSCKKVGVIEMNTLNTLRETRETLLKTKEELYAQSEAWYLTEREEADVRRHMNAYEAPDDASLIGDGDFCTGRD